MNRFVFILISIVGISNVWAQNTTDYKYVIFFKDKAPELSSYSVQRPEEFLSQRSIQRRIKYNIGVTEQDLPVFDGYIQQVFQQNVNIRYLSRSKWMNYIVVSTKDSLLDQKLSSLQCVKQVKRIFAGIITNPATLTQPPSDNVSPAFPEQLKYGKTEVQNTMIGLDYLHAKGYMGNGIHIAVVDAGFRNVHAVTAFDYMRREGKLLGTWDFVDNEEDVYEDNSHGTSVLSTIAAIIDNEYMGAAPQAAFWLLRSEDAATETISEEYVWISALEFADSVGVDVVNSSLGYTTFDNPFDNHSYNALDGNTTIITKGADIAAAKGILVVNSAGNSGNSGWKYLGAPADADSILTVGAVNDQRIKAGFSSFGPTKDGRVKPDVCAMGQGTLVIGPGGVPSPSNGTSFSSPIMAGAAACLLQKHPQKNPIEIIKALRASANLFQSPSDGMGYGIPNLGIADLLLQNKSTQDLFAKQQLKVYPNPLLGSTLYVDFYANSTEIVQMSITDSKGNVIWKGEQSVILNTMHTINIQLNGPLAKGVYFLNIQTAERKFTAKFIPALQ